MPKIYTGVKFLSLLALLASPSAFAGRDSGGNGDSRIMGAGDDVHSDGSRVDRCREAARTTEEARQCDNKNSEEMMEVE